MRTRERHPQKKYGVHDRNHQRQSDDEPSRNAVRELSRRKRQQRQRDELREPDEPDVERMMVDPVDLPADRNRNHLHREHTREVRDPVRAEIAIAE